MVPGQVKLSRKREDQRHRMLRDRLLVGALRAGKTHPAARIGIRANWSVPALTDWMKRRRAARARRSLRHKPDTTRTSASATRAARLLGVAHLEVTEGAPRARNSSASP